MTGRWILLAAGIGLLAQQAQQPAPPVFRAATTLIEVDAIVKDKGGRFVADLSPGDFELLEEGAPQKIEAFYVVKGREVVPGTVVPSPPVSSPVRPLVPPPPAVPRTERVFVVFFDLEHMAPGSVDRAKKAAEEFLTRDFQAGDIGGVVAGGTMVNKRLTSSLEELQAAVRSVNPLDTARTRRIDMREWPRLLDPFEAYQVGDRQDKESISRAVRRACNDDAGACRGPAGSLVEQQVIEKARRMVTEYRAGGQRTMHSVSGLASGLTKLPGRKTIIFLSDGFFTEEAWANLRVVTDLAARASVRVYSLDTRGLNRGTAGSEILEQGPRGFANPAGDVAGFDTASDGPNSLAIDTGGLMIRNENDFVKAFHAISEDTGSYYILGYRPADTKADGRFRAIKVNVKRAGLSVRARRGYIATSDRLAAPPESVAVPEPGAPPLPAPAPPPVAPGPEPTKPVEPSRNPETPAPAAAAPANLAGESERTSEVRAKPRIGERVDLLTSMTAPAGSDPVSEALVKRARAGWEAYQKGDVEVARTELSAAASDPKAPAWVRYALGWSQYALSDYRAAGQEWEKVRSAVPQFEAVYFDLADAYLQQREFGRAVATLRVAENRWPADVEVYNALGVIQAGRGALNEAIESFQKGVSAKPTDATACYNLAKSLELRYVQAQRLRRNSSTQAASEILADREQALEYYRRTVELGGPLAEQAKEGLRRLGGKGD